MTADEITSALASEKSLITLDGVLMASACFVPNEGYFYWLASENYEIDEVFDTLPALVKGMLEMYPAEEWRIRYE